MIYIFPSFFLLLLLLRAHVDTNQYDLTDKTNHNEKYSLFSAFEEGVEFNGHLTAQCLSEMSHGAVCVD